MKDYSQCLDELPEGPGCYLARNKINNKGYLGQAWCIRKRIKNGHCKNPWYNGSTRNKCRAFYAALRKYGVDAFTWQVVWEANDGKTTQDEMDMMEINFIKHLDTHVSRSGYNIALGGMGSRGVRHTEESKKKIGDAHRGKKYSAETKKKIGDAHRGKKVSAKNKQKMSDFQKGRKKSTEHKKKIADAHRGRKRLIECCDNMRKAKKYMKGKYSRHHKHYHFSKARNVWAVEIMNKQATKPKNLFWKTFQTEEEAIAARDKYIADNNLEYYN